MIFGEDDSQQPDQPQPYEHGDLRLIQSLTRLIQSLTDALSHADSDGRFAAALQLADLRSPLAFEPLIQTLIEDGCSQVEEGARRRRDAAEKLGLFGDKRAVEPLIPRLLDAWPEVREAVARALGRLDEPELAQHVKGDDADFDRLAECGDSRVVDSIIRVLKLVRREDYPFEAVARAAGAAGDPRAVEPLIKALRIKYPVPTPKAAALALGELGDHRAVGPLIDATRHEHSDVWGAAARSLHKLGVPRGDEVLLAKTKSDRVNAVAAFKVLAELGHPQAFDMLMRLRSRGRYRYSFELARGLGRLVDRRAIRMLIRMCKEKEPAAVSELEEVLTKDATVFEEEDLHAVTRLEDFTIFYEETSDPLTAAHWETFSCAGLRHIAQQELTRRGLQP